MTVSDVTPAELFALETPSWQAEVLLTIAEGLGWVRPLRPQGLAFARFIGTSMPSLFMFVLGGISAYMAYKQHKHIEEETADGRQHYATLVIPIFIVCYFAMSVAVHIASFGGPNWGLAFVLREMSLPALRTQAIIAFGFMFSILVFNGGTVVISFVTSYQPLGPIFQNKIFIIIWFVCVHLDLLGLLSTLALLTSLPIKLSEALSAVRTALKSEDFIEGKRLYGTFLHLQQAARPAYQAIALPFATFGVAGTALLLSGFFGKFYGKNHTDLLDEVWLAMTVFTLVWIATPAAEVARQHSRLVTLLATMTCVELTDKNQREARSDMLSLFALMRDNAGFRLGGQLVTYRLFTTLISLCSILFSLTSILR